MYSKEILKTAGQWRVNDVIGQFSRPYTLKTQNLSIKEIPLVEVIKGFNNELTEQNKRYLHVFQNHMRKEKHFISSYAFSMRNILKEEVELQLPKLNFDDDPVSVEILLELQKFDKLSFSNV